MKRLKESPSKAISVATRMPALPHQNTSGEFDILKSKAAQWLVAQPEILQAVFNHYNYQGAIVFDKETQTWKGAKI